MPVKSGIERAEGPVVAMAHFNSLTQSLLAFATTKGRVHGWDLRAKKEAWLMSNPLSHGIVQVRPSSYTCIAPADV
jgi:phosphoinositide-3-kinase regulatory subunit 4